MAPAHYPASSASPDFPALEQDILAFWREQRVFAASVDSRPAEKDGASNRFVFYDGPPFANGLPHYGHLLTGYVKDVIARYQTMKGKRVERRFGWDCHGLPAEMGAEKELALSGRQAIIDYGIGRFNDYCRANVMRYADEWKRYVERQARWVDMEDDYKTMDRDYMESVIWAFKQFHDKGLIYEAYRVLPYSWGAETPLSAFETRLDNATRERTDKAVTVAFELTEKPTGAPDAAHYYVLAWTTTPWTLPSNLALAVNTKMRYAAILQDGSCYLLAEWAVESYKKEFPALHSAEGEGLNVAAMVDGSALLGRMYHPLFPFFADHPQSFRILDGTHFVEAGSGTGIVHMAPGFGEEDQRVCEAAGIKVVVPVDGAGRYTDEIYDLPTLQLRGLNVIADMAKDEAEPYTDAQLAKYGLANLRIASWLKEQGRLIRQEDYVHNYPHCWRTDTPLIYRAMPSTYIRVTAFKDRAGELNRNIRWIPGHVRDGQMGHMLATAPDWSISRNRFWGCPIPVWKSDNPDNKTDYVFGSIQELEEFFGPHMSRNTPSSFRERVGERATPPSSGHAESDPLPNPPPEGRGDKEEERSFRVHDLHRPFIDTLTAPDPTNPAYTLRRVEDVLDCWFESGSMPFAQLHYPFENKEKFERNFPADFITEYIAQTRGWFNSLIMIGTGLGQNGGVFDSEPFENCICHGVVVDEDGEKLSKRKGNYPDPLTVFDQFGSDALRWFMMSSAIMRGSELQIDAEGAFIRDAVRLYIKPLWNAYHFFCLYANADGVKAELRTDSANAMDRYILAKLGAMLESVQAAFDGYDTPSACQSITQFLESLNNWYIRRNRARFWKGEVDADKLSAFHTLYTVLHRLTRAAAPLLPLTTEAIFAGLTQGGEYRAEGSVHLQLFPKPSELNLADESILMRDMDHVRDVCNAALAIRNAENIRIRQPLESLTVYGASPIEQGSEYTRLIEEEVNVKLVLIEPELEEAGSKKLKLNFPVVGKRLGGKMKEIGAAAKRGEWELDEQGIPHVCGEALMFDEYELLLEPKQSRGTQALASGEAIVILDLTLDETLLAEGLARDVVRLIQQSRKEAGFSVSDRIHLVIDADETVAAAIDTNRTYIAEQTLATILEFGDTSHDSASPSGHIARGEIDGKPIALRLEKVAA